MNRKIFAALVLCATTTAFAAPKIESMTVEPAQPKFTGDKPPEVEVSVSVARSKFDKGGCDARVDFGDGEGRTLDFDVASKRNVKHTYKKGGNYTVSAKGSGSRACEGTQQKQLVVQGPPPPKPAAKKAEAKKAEPKKAEKKAPAKKPAAKKDDKKAPAKKAPAKKDEKKKDDATTK
jgi:PKD repeat protein